VTLTMPNINIECDNSQFNPVFVILSQFDPNFFKTGAISSLFKLRENLTFI